MTVHPGTHKQADRRRHAHTDGSGCRLPAQMPSLLLPRSTNRQRGPCMHTVTVALSPSVPPSPSRFSISPTLMHYRPLLRFSDLGLSCGLNLLSTQARAHMQTATTLTFLAHRTRLDFQYRFVLQHSTPFAFSPLPVPASIPPSSPPVCVNLIRPVRLLPACPFLFFNSFCIVFPAPAFFFLCSFSFRCRATVLGRAPVRAPTT